MKDYRSNTSKLKDKKEMTWQTVLVGILSPIIMFFYIGTIIGIEVTISKHTKNKDIWDVRTGSWKKFIEKNEIN